MCVCVCVCVCVHTYISVYVSVCVCVKQLKYQTTSMYIIMFNLTASFFLHNKDTDFITFWILFTFIKWFSFFCCS